MYLKKIIDKNVGPITSIEINCPFNSDGTPKPIILVGENGSGKSTLISNIVDSFYQITSGIFTNSNHIMEQGLGTQYFKIMSDLEIHIGQNYLYSLVFFDNDISYIFKEGMLDLEALKKEASFKENISGWEKNGHIKRLIGVNKDKAEQAFNQNIVCYFSPERYERPFWLGTSYYNDLNLHFNLKEKFNGEITNPIMAPVSGEENLQWLLDVIADSRVDVLRDESGEYVYSVKKPNDIAAMVLARENIEKVMSSILRDNIYFGLNLRSAGQSRFNICRKEDNAVIVPTLDSLSTGQLALFNMFATIIRYADNNDISKSIRLQDIQGIVVIDEIELHLHTSLQKEVLPQLLHLFPKIQFIFATHSPLFLLGMKDVFGEDNFEIYQLPDGIKINVERFSEFDRAYNYFADTGRHQSEIKAVIDRYVGRSLVVTEGATDWKHMKAAFNALSKDQRYKEFFKSFEFDFLEYEPEDSKVDADNKIKMGNSALVSMCESMAKVPQKRKLIFIADRDDKETNKKLSAKDCLYKSWGNNVYSFVLPLPESRKNTPSICIEHYYSDEEIKTPCSKGGIERRLFMGNEFDEDGFSHDGMLQCKNLNYCGPGKISIIDGQSKCRVIRTKDNPPRPNIALPKMDFAENVLNKAPGFDKFNFDTFLEIFKVIEEIINLKS